ncbi:MAG: hypothetical protein ABFR02_11050 [Campylobacterota bacterium]
MANTYFKKLILYTLVILSVSIVYFAYAYTMYPPTEENETFLSEIGEGFGVVGLWGLLFIYGRTVLKLLMGRGSIAKRLLPDYTPPAAASIFQRLLKLLNSTHAYVGVATVAVILIHIALMDGLTSNLFFPAVLLLIVWQALFGLFLSWRYTPKELKKFAYLVHAQFFTGIMIGIFAFFGHLLVDS